MANMVTHDLATPARGESQAHQLIHHAMPGWYKWLHKHVFLSVLILASGVLNALALTLGLVPNIGDAAGWTWLDGLLVGTFTALGLLVGGMVVMLSNATAVAWRRRQWGLLAFLGAGLAFFASFEVWASLVKRAGNIPLSIPDAKVMHLAQLRAGGPDILTPTAIFVAVAGSAIGFYWGFVNAEEPPVDLTSKEQTLQAKLLEAEMKAKIHAAQAAGWMGAARAGVLAARGQSDDNSSPMTPSNSGQIAPDRDPNPDDDGPGGGRGLPVAYRQPMPGPRGSVSTIKYPALPRNSSGLARGQGTQPETWNWEQVREYVESAYGVELSRTEALNLIKACDGAHRDATKPGRPLVASRKQLEQKVRLALGIRGAGVPSPKRMAARDLEQEQQEQLSA